jgi:hypothetical protein
MGLRESIELSIDDQAFLRLYDSASIPPLSRLQVVSLSQSSCMSPVELTDGKGVGGWRGAKSYDCEKYWSSIYHSILSMAYKLLKALTVRCQLVGGVQY